MRFRGVVTKPGGWRAAGTFLKPPGHTVAEQWPERTRAARKPTPSARGAIDRAERRQDMATGVHSLLIGRLNFQDKNNIIL